MKKRIVAALLALVLTFGAMPGAAFAQAPESPGTSMPDMQQTAALPGEEGQADSPVSAPTEESEGHSRLLEAAVEEATASSITGPQTQASTVEEVEPAPPADTALPQAGNGSGLSQAPLSASEVEYTTDGSSWATASFADAAAAVNAAQPSESAQIKLKSDVTLDTTYTFTKPVTILSDANATIYRKDSFKSGALFNVASSGALTLNKVTVDGKASVGNGIASGVKAEAPLVVVNGGRLTLTGGTVLQNAWNGSSDGGAVRVDSGGMTMQGGSVIRNCSALNGGGICLNGSSTLKTETSGNTTGVVATLQENQTSSKGKGGGLYAVSSAESNISNMKLTGNRATEGGAIYLSSGSLISSGAANEISRNTSSGGGGAVYVAGGQLSFGNTSIRENSSSGNGGGLYLNGGSVFLDLAQLIRNETSKNGGGAYIQTGTLTLKNGAGSGAGVRGNKAKAGGGLYLNGTGAEVVIGNSGSSGTVEICENKATGVTADGFKTAAGGVYLGDGASLRMDSGANMTVTQNSTSMGSTSIGAWAEETACGGIYLAENASLQLRGTVKITENTVSHSGKRQVNLLVENQAGGARTQIPVNNQWSGGLSSGSKIGISLTHWPQAGQFFQFLGNYDEKNNSAGNISSAFETYFISDRTPYGTSAGFDVVVNTEGAYPQGELEQAHENKVYLTYQSRVPAAAQVSIQDKYYDGDADATAAAVNWTGVAAEDEEAFSGLEEGVDYTVTASFAGTDVAYGGSGVAEQNVTGTISLTNEALLAKYPEFASYPFTAQASIWPVPVTVSFEADDRAYSAGETGATVTQGSAAVRLADQPEPGAPALPSDLPVSPAYGTDYTLTNVRFADGEGEPTDQVGEHQVLAEIASSASRNYIWKEVEPALASILRVELTASAAVPDKIYDGTPSMAGTPTVTLASATETSASDGYNTTLVQGKDFTIESAAFDSKEANPAAGAAVQIKLTEDAAKIYTIRQTENVTTDENGITTIRTTGAITQKEVNLTGACVYDKKHDGTTAATAYDLKFEGLVPGESFTEGDYTYTADFADASVGTDKEVTVTAVLQKTEVTRNYVLGVDTITAYANIAPVALNASLTAEGKTYDGTADVAKYNLSFEAEGGAVALTEGEDYHVAAGPVFDDKNAGSRTVSMEIELLGDSARNYTLASGSLTAQAEIAKKDVTPVVEKVPDKVYDGTAQVVDTETEKLTVSLAGCIPGETLKQGVDYSVSGQFVSKAGEAAKDAANGKPVEVTVVLTDSALAKNYRLSPAVAASSADIIKRPLTVASASVADKLYDGTVNAQVTALRFEGVLPEEPLERNRDWRIVSARFDTPDTGLDKPVHVVAALMDSPLSKNYVLAQDNIRTTADVTNHLDVNGAYTGEVSSGSLTVDEIDSWIRANFTDVLPGKPQVTFKDKDGREIGGIDKAQAGAYTVDAVYSDGAGRTAAYHIQWTLTAKPAPEPAPPSSAPEPPAAAPIGVQTGDSFPILLLAIALALACTAIVALLIVEHRRKHGGK